MYRENNLSCSEKISLSFIGLVVFLIVLRIIFGFTGVMSEYSEGVRTGYLLQGF